MRKSILIAYFFQAVNKCAFGSVNKTDNLIAE